MVGGLVGGAFGDVVVDGELGQFLRNPALNKMPRVSKMVIVEILTTYV